jgi:hypothetical protein
LNQPSTVRAEAGRREGASGKATWSSTPSKLREGAAGSVWVGRVVDRRAGAEVSVTSAVRTYMAWLPAVAAVLAETAV